MVNLSHHRQNVIYAHYNTLFDYTHDYMIAKF